MAKEVTKESIRRQTIRDMKALGTYKKQYDKLIDIYAELVEQYSKLSTEFAEGGYQYEVSTDQGGAKKAPIVATLETLRKDILAYSDRLCLNPKAFDTVTTESGKKSTLASVLKKLS